MKLIVIENGIRSEFEFDRERISIGRALDNELRLNDPRISRHHCSIEKIGDAVFFVDQGSQNGSIVNGETVTKKPLVPGDVIQVGKIRICYERIPPEGQSGHETAVLQAVTHLSDETFIRELTRERDNLLVLQKINQAINSERSLKALLNLIVDSAISLTHAERGFVILGHGEKIKFEVARNFAREPVEMPELKTSRSITSKVRETGQPILSLNAQEDDRFRDFSSVSDLALLSVICLPIKIKGKIEGVLYVDNRLQKGVFSEEDLDLLQGLAEQAAISINNAQLFDQLAQSNQSLQDQAQKIQALNTELDRKIEDQETELQATREALVRERGRQVFPQIIGESVKMKAVFQLLEKVIATDFPVLIEGESGTGKELIARAIHANGARKDKPFVTENCAALSDSLLESELFGHIKGAFTGAHKTRKGLLELADGGVLFLDEVGEMTSELQKKLLRFLQEGEVRPVGSDRVVHTNVRIVSASNRKLDELVKAGKFREDLFYRLNVLKVELPPLRERKGDIPLLVEHLLRRWIKETKSEPKKITSEALQLLEQYPWPGNIRELENEVRKWVILDGSTVTEEMISEPIRMSRFAELFEESDTQAGSLPHRILQVEIRSIRTALEKAQGNKSRAAQLLGISRFALQRRLDKLQIEGIS